MFHILGSLPCPCLCQRHIIGMLCQSPVNISFCGNIGIKHIQNISCIIVGIIFNISIPLLIKRNVYLRTTAHALDRCIEHPECLGILLHIGFNIRMCHVIPFLTGIDFIGNNPVGNFPVFIVGIAVCKKGADCSHIFYSRFFRTIECIIG